MTANDGQVWYLDMSDQASHDLEYTGSLWSSFDRNLEDVLDFRLTSGQQKIPDQVLSAAVERFCYKGVVVDVNVEHSTAKVSALLRD